MLAEYIYSESPETVTCYSLLADNDVDTFEPHFYRSVVLLQVHRFDGCAPPI
jgi:hypothetical protein